MTNKLLKEIKKIKDILIALGVGSAIIESQTTQIVFSPLEYLCNPMYLNPYYWKARKLINEGLIE